MRNAIPASISVVTLGFDGALASSITGPADLLHVANSIRSAYPTQSKLAVPHYSWNLAAAGPFKTTSGANLIPSIGLKDAAACDLLIVPGFGGYDADERRSLLASQSDIMEFLALQLPPQTPVTGLCTGVLLLAEAGLLSGRQATTSWWNTQEAKDSYPSVKFQTDHMVIKDGRITTAGAGAAYFDAILSWIAIDAGASHAERIARYFVLNQGRASQVDFVIPLIDVLQDPRIAKADRWVRKADIEDKSVAALARHLGMSPRSMQRYFNGTLRQSPRAFIQTVRLGMARTLLQTSQKSVDEIAILAGYSDTNAFRRAFRAQHGFTASAMRQMSQSKRNAQYESWARLHATAV